jgi:hypothetical protein
MKKYILILFFSSFCYSQSEEVQTKEAQTKEAKYKKDKIAKDSADRAFGFGDDLTCEIGLKEAENDFNKGIYNSYSYGFLVEKRGDNGFDSFYKEYVLKTYSINIANKGCVVSEYSKCYSSAMQKLIYKKFGSDIYSKSRNEALELFSKKE